VGADREHSRVAFDAPDRLQRHLARSSAIYSSTSGR
jgi:hypothetical protein